MDDKAYSVRLALKELDEVINEMDKEVKELEAAIKALDKPNDSMIIEYGQKKELYDSLLARKQKLESLSNSSSFGLTGGYKYSKIAKNDQKMVELDKEINDKIKREKSISESSNRRVANAKYKLQHKIEQLKEKQGRMEEKQRKITNKKLNEELKLLKLRNKRIGTEESGEFLYDYYNEQKENHLDEFLERISGNVAYKPFAATGELFKFLNSARKQGTIKARTFALSKLQGLAYGATKLNSEIKQVVREAFVLNIDSGRSR